MVVEGQRWKKNVFHRYESSKFLNSYAWLCTKYFCHLCNPISQQYNFIKIIDIMNVTMLLLMFFVDLAWISGAMSSAASAMTPSV